MPPASHKHPSAPEEPGSPPERRPRSGGLLGSRLAIAVLFLLLGFLAVEGALRFLLFHPSAQAMRWCEGLRDPGFYADPHVEDVYWRLDWLFDPRSRGKIGSFDPLLGWTGGRLEASSYRLKAPPEAAGRRPLLLFGADGVAPEGSRDAADGDLEARWQASALADDYALWNHGIAGQSIDQMYLLAREIVPQHRGERPVVVIAADTGADFEGANGSFRHWPKPLLTPRADGLDLAPPAASVRAFMERSGYGVTSFAWRGLLHGTDWLPHRWRDALAGGPRRRAEQTERIEAIVRALRTELESQGVPYFFVLLHGPDTLRPEAAHGTLFTTGQPPADRALLDLFEREGIPFVDARPYLGTPPKSPAAAAWLPLEALEVGLQRFAGP